MMSVPVKLYAIILIAFSCLSVRAEFVTLFNDNGEGGIHQSVGQVTVRDGQYYVKFGVKEYGRITEKQLKVYRVADDFRDVYRQPGWAEKYVYVANLPIGWGSVRPYYFNMESAWIPSMTERADDPARVTPVCKVDAYYDDFSGGYDSMRALVVRRGQTLMLYWGDEMFASTVMRHNRRLECEPSWASRFSYYAQVSGRNVFFNISP